MQSSWRAGARRAQARKGIAYGTGGMSGPCRIDKPKALIMINLGGSESFMPQTGFSKAFSSESLPRTWIAGWTPVPVKKTLQTKRLKPRFDRDCGALDAIPSAG